MSFRQLQFTPEQAQAIKSGDIAARNAFFWDNLDIFSGMAAKYCYRMGFSGNAYFTKEELLQQLYIDLPYLNYATAAYLSMSIIKQSFRLMPLGGLSFFIENHIGGYNDNSRRDLCFLSCDDMVRIDNDDTVMPKVDTLAFAPSVDDLHEGLSDLAFRSLLSRFLKPQHLELFLLYCQGYSQIECCRKCGVKTFPKATILKTLRKHASEIVDALVQADCTAAMSFIDCEPCETAPQRRYKTTPEQRARNTLYIQRWRAKQAAKKAAALTAVLSAAQVAANA